MPPPALPARAPPPFYGAPPSCQCGLPTVTTARSSLPAPLSPSTGATACPRYVNTVYQSHLVCFPRIYQFLVHPSQRPIVSLPHRFASRPPSIRLPTGHKRSPHAPISVRSLFVHPPVITARSSLPAPLSPSTGATACPRYVNTVYQSHLVCFPRIYQFLVHPPSSLLFHSPTVSLPVRPPFVYSPVINARALLRRFSPSSACRHTCIPPSRQCDLPALYGLLPLPPSILPP